MISWTGRGAVPLLLLLLAMAVSSQAFSSVTGPTPGDARVVGKVGLMAAPRGGDRCQDGPRTAPFAAAALLGATLLLAPITGPDGSSGSSYAAAAADLGPPPSSSLTLLAAAADTATSLDFSLPSSYDPKMSGFGEGKEAYLNSPTSNTESSSEKEKELIAMRRAEEARKEALAKKKAEAKAREEETKRRAELKKRENAERLKNIFN